MKKLCPGFTLIELLVTISIIVVLVGLGTAKYIQFNRHQILVQNANELKSSLRLAQSQALGGQKDCEGILDGYLVTLGKTGYSIKSQCSNPAGGKSYGTELPPSPYSYSGGVEMSSGPPSILFKVLAQGVEGEGTITLTLSGAGNETVIVTKTGQIY